MKKIILKLLKSLAKPLLGKGYIDKHLPFLIPVFQTFYAKSQKENIKKVEIPLGLSLLIFTKDIGVGLPLILKGTYEKIQTNHFLKELKETDTVLDIGANVGYYSVLGAKIATKGHVYAFEPDPETFELLTRNIEENKLSNIKVIEKAVSDQNGEIFFNVEKSNKGESAINDQGKGEKVMATTIDKFVEDEGIRKIDIIKMDIEGAEYLALKGAQKTLKKNKIKLYIEYNPSSIKKFGRKPSENLKLIKDLGFDIKKIFDEPREQEVSFSEENLSEVLKNSTYTSLFCTNF